MDFSVPVTSGGSKALRSIVKRFFLWWVALIRTNINGEAERYTHTQYSIKKSRLFFFDNEFNLNSDWLEIEVIGW